MQKKTFSSPENSRAPQPPLEAEPQNPSVEKEIDLNALFPEEKTDLNKLFPDMEIKRLLKKISRNKKTLQGMTRDFSEEIDPDHPENAEENHR